MNTPVSKFSVAIEPVSDFEFRVRWDKETFSPLVTDEPPPLGKDAGPNPSRMLAAAVGNCLAASLTFCLKKAGIESQVRADVSAEIVRNENRRLRIGHLEVVLQPLGVVDESSLRTCESLFEDYCTVTESVRGGLDVRVRVEPEKPSPVPGF